MNRHDIIKTVLNTLKIYIRFVLILRTALCIPEHPRRRQLLCLPTLRPAGVLIVALILKPHMPASGVIYLRPVNKGIQTYRQRCDRCEHRRRYNNSYDSYERPHRIFLHAF